MDSRKILALALSIIFHGATAHAQTTSSCRLLVENQNDLWLARPDGHVISRITSDGQLKPAAALQPGGRLVAYSTLDSSRDLVLSDSTGHIVNQASIGAGDAVTGLDWTASDALRIAIHDGPATSQYHFFRIQPGNRLVRSSPGIAQGSACALSPNGKQMACLVADALTVDGKDIFYLGGPHEAAGALAWSPNGQHIAIVEANDAGQAALLLLQNRGAVEARLEVPIAGPISSIRFRTNTSIEVKGRLDVVEYAVPATGVVKSASNVLKPLFLRSNTMPLHVNGTVADAIVKDWTCEKQR
ncbi:hypothetical protein GM658_23805 [Pseudoduganella eburnea]|uniref:WD40 repeat domain-containing protein n=1 Tax=Massilia eburnea TaxID=1776165 RepID=A0A6L6QMS1_9BURK|nr:hypothetical protein [Massilia eburnea]MTW13639.1 hypothetical protein [Massilia eburnea]